MGYGLMPYKVKIDNVISLIGSRDKVYIKGFLNYYYERIIDIDRQLHSDKNSIDVAISTLTDPDYRDEQIYKQSYVIELIVSSIGELLPNHCWSPCSFPEFLYFDPAIRRDTQDAYDQGIVRGDDFPGVFVIRYQNARSVIERISVLKDDSIDEEQKEQFSGWLNQAIDSEEDIVIYHY
ncbi:DUF7691 family protein [Endozoicomonas arenosclerae]|uniref:DUF7691 family protein n=1 Tax=Endozoicomonas arenosclerae TaxID=1633495 RepID=UPI0007829350|nr:hypothetical protein [Endozoicomonas arenosclerae]